MDKANKVNEGVPPSCYWWECTEIKIKALEEENKQLKEEHKIMRKMLGATHWNNVMKMEEVLSEEETDIWNKLSLQPNTFSLNQ
jgi:hypothetical protein